jgi:hypothetical protein
MVDPFEIFTPPPPPQMPPSTFPFTPALVIWKIPPFAKLSVYSKHVEPPGLAYEPDVPVIVIVVPHPGGVVAAGVSVAVEVGVLFGIDVGVSVGVEVAVAV